MKRVLLTGANGFIGHAVLQLLAEQGYPVRAVYHRSRPCVISHSQIPIEWTQHDLSDDQAGTDPLMQGVDTVIHLAGRAHVVDDTPAARDAHRRLNTLMTQKLAESAAQTGIRRFIFMSTIKVHGEQSGMDTSGRFKYFSETDVPRPEDAYALSKLEAEQALKEAGQSSDMKYVILRPPLVYGPGVKANFLKLLNAVARGWPLPFAAITNLRSLMYSGNLADIVLKCLSSPTAADKTYLVKDTDLSLPALLRQIAACMEKKARLFSVPDRWLDMAGRITGRQAMFNRLSQSLLADNSLMMNDLQWSPLVEYPTGLEQTVKWYGQRLNGNL